MNRTLIRGVQKMKKLTFSEQPYAGDPEIILQMIGRNLKSLFLIYDPDRHSDQYHITIVCKDLSIIIKMLTPDAVKPSYIIYVYLKQDKKDNLLLLSLGMTYYKNIPYGMYSTEVNQTCSIISKAIADTIDTFNLNSRDLVMITNLDEVDIKQPWHRLNIKRSDKRSIDMFLKWVSKNLGETTKVVFARLHVILYPNTIDQLEGFYNFKIEKSKVFSEETYNLCVDIPMADTEYWPGLTFEDLRKALHAELEHLFDKLKPICLKDETCELEYFCY